MGKKFVVISNQRTGSSHLCRLLDSHPDVVCRQEDLRKKEDRTKSFLDKLYANARKHKAFGFKAQFSHISEQVEDYFLNEDVFKVVLLRKDLLETSLWFKAHHIGKTSGGLGPPLKLQKDSKVIAKLDSVTNYMKWLKRHYDHWLPLADFVVEYDDYTCENGCQDFADKQVRKQLLEALGVEDRELYSEVNKKNKRPPNSECVENWQELLDEVDKLGLRRYYK